MRRVYSRQHSADFRSRWIRLEFSQSFVGQPVRPLLRCLLADGSVKDQILPAAVFGKARWIGLAPPDLQSLEILAPLGDRQDIRIDRLTSFSEAKIARTILRRRPSRVLNYLLTRSSGSWRRGVMARTALDLKRMQDFEQFAAERERALEPDGLDASLFRPKVHVGALGFVMAALDEGEILPALQTLRSLGQQSDPAFRLTIAASESVTGVLSAEISRLELGSRVALVDAPNDTPSDTITLALARRIETAWVALLRPGDGLDPKTVLLVRDHLEERSDLAVVYADSAETDAWTGKLMPQLKPDWSPTFLKQIDYVRRPCFYRQTSLALAAQSVSVTDPSPWWSLLPTVAAAETPKAIGHLKRVLVRSPPRPPVEIRPLQPLTVPADTTAAGDGPVVSIIVPTRDRDDLLKRLIASLIAITTTQLRYEVVIVDNESTTDSAISYLTSLKSDPRFLVVEQPGHFNFSELINVGVAAAHGNVLLFMNNDCEITTSDWLDRLVSLAIEPEIGAVGALLLFADDKIQHAGVTLGLGGGAGHRDRNMRAEGHFGHLFRMSAAHEITAVTGACLAVSRDKFEAVGGLDPAFAIAFNDVDFCVRLQERGYRNLLDPHAVVKHLESASRGKDQGAKLKRFEREAALFRERWATIVHDDPFFHPLFSTSRFNDWLE